MHCDYLKVIFSVFSAYLYKCAELSYQSFSVRALKFLVVCFNNLFFFLYGQKPRKSINRRRANPEVSFSLTAVDRKPLTLF